jgi:hypothetical protein
VAFETLLGQNPLSNAFFSARDSGGNTYILCGMAVGSTPGLYETKLGSTGAIRF